MDNASATMGVPVNKSESEEDEEWINRVQNARTITFIVASSCTIAISFYAIIVLTWNEVRRCKRPRRTSNSDRKYRTLMEHSIYACCIFGFVRFMILGADCIIEAGEVDSCNILNGFKIVTNMGAFAFAYLALWFRQRVFYISPSIRHITSPFTRVLSIAVLPMLIATAMFFTVIFFLTARYDLDRFGCKQSSSVANQLHLRIAVGVALLSYQIGLLFLFLYPLIKHWKIRNSAPLEGSRPVFLLRQALYIAFTVITVDITTTLLQETVNFGYNIVHPLTKAVELLVYVTCSCLLIPNWRNVMFPFCRKFQGEQITTPSTECD